MTNKGLFTRKRNRVTAIMIAGAIGAITLWMLTRDAKGDSEYAIATVERTSLSSTVTATGTLEAVRTVQVGSQISGQLQELFADFNSVVEKGQLLARIDPRTFATQVAMQQAQVESAEARLHAAEANLANQQANLLQTQANLDAVKAAGDSASISYERAQLLLDQGLIAKSEYDVAKSNADAAAAKVAQANAAIQQARASVRSQEAQITQSRSEITGSRAELQRTAVNLEMTNIYSPVDGVVISRNVEIGQTVAASLSAPTLFVIANDLAQMQVNASIDEADIGKIRKGTPVVFSVDAYPQDAFTGVIDEIRLNPTTVQNVVTYSVIVKVANPEFKLKPGMTANLNVTVDSRENVLTVPNAALRFRPSEAAASDATTTKKAGSATIWSPGPDGIPVARQVRVGITNGSHTEVTGGDLQEGMAILIGSQTGSTTTGRTATPAMPFGVTGAGGNRGGR